MSQKTELLSKITPKSGLTDDAVKRQRAEFGRNELIAKAPVPLYRKIWRHLSDVSSLVLLFAVALSTYLALFREGGWTKTIVIGAVLVINVVIGLYQESSAEKSLAALKSMSLPQTNVRRNGQDMSVAAVELVPGDLVHLKVGDQVPADGIIISATSLAVDEAILTGESEVVSKTAYHKADKVKEDQKVYSGTAVVGGRALMQVGQIGMATELGKIAGLINQTEQRATPLQGKLDHLSKWMTFFAGCGGLIIFALSIGIQNKGVADSLMVGLSLAVAAVPETLPIIVTISLSHGVQRMAAQGTIMRRVGAVETIGNVDIIATDKTGTLTQNKMSITKYWTPSTGIKSAKAELPQAGCDLVRYLGLATNAKVTEAGGKTHAMGDATEIAIVNWLDALGTSRQELEETAPRIAEDPFDSNKKMMTTVHQLQDGRKLVIVKGAWDRLPLKKDAVLEAGRQAHDELAAAALRIIAVGYKILPEDVNEKDWEKINTNLELAGLVGLIDPPPS